MKRINVTTSDGTAEEQLAIHALVARYADAVNLADAALWADTWDQAAVWDLGGRRVEGRDDIVALWTGAMASFESVIQVVTHGSVQVTGDTAAGRWTLFEVDKRDGEGLFVVGCYRDRYVQRDGAWSFSERQFTATYRGPLPVGTFTAFPPIG